MESLRGMAYSDVFVLTALKELINARGETALIKHRDICESTDMPITTVRYALRRLMVKGDISIEHAPGIGNYYRIKQPSEPRTTPR